MKTPLLCAALLVCLSPSLPAGEKEIPNPKIDYSGFLEDAVSVAKLRAQRRLTEEEFLRMSAEPGTIILDARSNAKYDMLHIRGAQNLSLPDMTEATLAKIIPSKDTRVLIYCNNNFEREEEALPSKAPRASLNIYTFNTLYSYGYRNIHELGPLLDITASKLPFEGSLREKR